MKMNELEDELKRVALNFENRLEPHLIADVIEYIDFGEVPLSIETLCDYLYDSEVMLTSGEFQDINRIAAYYKADPKRVSDLLKFTDSTD